MSQLILEKSQSHNKAKLRPDFHSRILLVPDEIIVDQNIQTQFIASWKSLANICQGKSGFLLGIFSGGAKSNVMQISIVMLLFSVSDQISGRGKSFQGGKLPQGHPLPPPVEESQK